MQRRVKESHFPGDDVGKEAEEEDSRPLETRSTRVIILWHLFLTTENIYIITALNFSGLSGIYGVVLFNRVPGFFAWRQRWPLCCGGSGGSAKSPLPQPPPWRPVRSPGEPRICLFPLPQPWWDSFIQKNSQCTWKSISVERFPPHVDGQVTMGFTISVKGVFWLAHWPSLVCRVLSYDYSSTSAGFSCAGTPSPSMACWDVIYAENSSTRSALHII